MAAASEAESPLTLDNLHLSGVRIRWGNGPLTEVVPGPFEQRRRRHRAAASTGSAVSQGLSGSQHRTGLRDMADFRAWCASQRPPLEALPAGPMTVALYVAALADVRKASTIRRRLSAISVVH